MLVDLPHTLGKVIFKMLSLLTYLGVSVKRSRAIGSTPKKKRKDMNKL